MQFNWDITNRITVSGSAGKVSQMLHLISGSRLGLPNDIWLTASKQFPIQKGEQYSLGFKLENKHQHLAFQLEGYYRQINGLIFYQPDELDLDFLPDPKQIEDFYTAGKGKVYGIESMFTFTNKRWNGWITYTWSKNLQSFPRLLKNRQLPSPYDQRHMFNLVVNGKLSSKWDISFLWTIQSGCPIFLPSAQYIGPDGKYIYIYPEQPSRFPTYRRFDIGFTYKHERDSGKYREWKFGVYNLFNRKNPLYLDLQAASYIQRGTNRSLIPPRIKGLSLLPFLPYISYQWTF